MPKQAPPRTEAIDLRDTSRIVGSSRRKIETYNEGICTQLKVLGRVVGDSVVRSMIDYIYSDKVDPAGDFVLRRDPNNSSINYKQKLLDNGIVSTAAVSRKTDVTAGVGQCGLVGLRATKGLSDKQKFFLACDVTSLAAEILLSGYKEKIQEEVLLSVIGSSLLNVPVGYYCPTSRAAGLMIPVNGDSVVAGEYARNYMTNWGTETGILEGEIPTGSSTRI